MVRDTILYNQLNISSDATDKDIKKAYHKLSMKWHPDKNIENKEEATEKFQKISEAYSILSDEKKRKMYDQIGIDILKNGSDGPSIDPTQIFEQFFGGGFGGFGGFPFGNMGGRPQRREEDQCVVEHFVTLEDIYNEKQTEVKFKQKNYCQKCDGTGCKNKKKTKCSNCNGNGKKVEVRQMGPMIQQFVTNCNICNGTGEIIEPNNICSSCNEKGFLVKNKSLNIPLKKHLEEGNQIRLSGKGHSLKSGRTNLIIVIKIKPHQVFKRDRYDLHMKVEVPLFQDLFGINKVITHLDNRKLLVQNDKTLKGEGILLIHNEGMSLQNGTKGNLFIHYKTKYPNLNILEENEKDVLRKILIKLDINEFKNFNKLKEQNCIKVNSKLIDEEYFKYQQQQNNYQEDENEGVQCAQQ